MRRRTKRFDMFRLWGLRTGQEVKLHMARKLWQCHVWRKLLRTTPHASARFTDDVATFLHLPTLASGDEALEGAKKKFHGTVCAQKAVAKHSSRYNRGQGRRQCRQSSINGAIPNTSRTLQLHWLTICMDCMSSTLFSLLFDPAGLNLMQGPGASQLS